MPKHLPMQILILMHHCTPQQLQMQILYQATQQWLTQDQLILIICTIQIIIPMKIPITIPMQIATKILTLIPQLLGKQFPLHLPERETQKAYQIPSLLPPSPITIKEKKAPQKRCQQKPEKSIHMKPLKIK